MIKEEKIFFFVIVKKDQYFKIRYFSYLQVEPCVGKRLDIREECFNERVELILEENKVNEFEGKTILCNVSRIPGRHIVV